MIRQLGLCRSARLLRSIGLFNSFCHAFLCEKAYNKYSISTLTCGKISKLSSLELNTVILCFVIVNKTSIAYWYAIYFIASGSMIDSFIYRSCLPIDDIMYRGADLCWALRGTICNFIPILPYFQHWGDEPPPRFCLGEQIKWRPKKGLSKKWNTFSSNSSGHLHSDAHQSQIIGGMHT